MSPLNFKEAFALAAGLAMLLAAFRAGLRAKGAEQNPLVQQLVTIAPAVNHADFYALTRVACPWLVVQGEKDEVVPAEEVIAWATAFKDRVKLKLLPDASHFFHGQLINLRQSILNNFA